MAIYRRDCFEFSLSQVTRFLPLLPDPVNGVFGGYFRMPGDAKCVIEVPHTNHNIQVTLKAL